jgi:hypothetical protein
MHLSSIEHLIARRHPTASAELVDLDTAKDGPRISLDGRVRGWDGAGLPSDRIALQELLTRHRGGVDIFSINQEIDGSNVRWVISP